MTTLRSSSPLLKPPTIIATCRAYFALEKTCSGVGDIPFFDYQIMLAAVSFKDGYPIKALSSNFLIPQEHLTSIVYSLERRGLVSLLRSSSDKRALAVGVAQKGLRLTKLIDAALGFTLIQTWNNLPSEVLESIIENAKSLEKDLKNNEKSTAEIMLPSFFLCLLFRFKMSINRASSQVGITSLQATSLLVLDDVKVEKSGEGISRYLQLSEPEALASLLNLEEAKLIAINEVGNPAINLTDAGINCVDEFLHVLTETMSWCFRDFSEQQITGMETTCECFGNL